MVELRSKKLAKWSEYYAWYNADHLCPVTHELAIFIKKAGVDEKNITVIANGINLKKFYVKGKAQRYKAFEDKLILGFVGFCREWHQLDKILELIARSSKENIILLIVGDGPASEKLKKKANLLNISNKLHITGVVEREVIPEWIDQFDIALQPAVTPWASPLKLIEYLAKEKQLSPQIQTILENY